MEMYYLSGTIYEASHEAMDELMRAVLGDIRARSRLFGYDILFETETMRLFCCTINNDGKEWSMNANFKEPLQNVRELLSRLTQKLIESGFNYSIGYNQIDENLNDIGDEVSLDHPDFDRLYAAYRAAQ